MKIKICLICLCFVFVLCLSSNDSEFRFRVIASSDDVMDVELKEEIADEINLYIIKNNITRNNINQYFDEIDKIVKEYTSDYTIEITKEKFPVKMINGKLSSSGKYVTLLITLQEGKGENYFSVLYPEYYNISYEDVHTGKVEVKSFIYEVFKKIFSR